MQVALQNISKPINAQAITALYDSKCPLCTFGVKKFKLDEKFGDLRYEDMRGENALKDEAVAQGIDLEKGVVIKIGDTLYSASDAVWFLSGRADHSTWFNRQINRVFRSKTRSRLIYPLLSAIRFFLMWLRRVPKIYEDGPNRKQSTIRTQLGEEWPNLHPNVQQRFASEPTVREQVFYRGTMDKVECSFAGKMFAQLTRLIGNPLTPYVGEDVHMDVTLYRKKGLAGVYWRRTYFFEGRTPYTVTSVKREDAKGRMTECVGAGFGMELQVTAQEGNLHFKSTRYFWQLGILRIPLPHILTPGETHVVHEDLRNGTFRFTIAMDHKQLGRTFFQTGVFKEA